MGMIRITEMWNKKKKRSFQKWTENWLPVFPAGSAGELKFAADGMLFWSAMYFQGAIGDFFILLILFILP